MFALSSGRAGDFEELGLAADEQEVAVIAASGRTPLEVVLPDGRCGECWALAVHLDTCRKFWLVLRGSCAPCALPACFWLNALAACRPIAAVLLGCNKCDGSGEVLAALREHLAAADGEAAVLAADVDGLQDAAAMRELLHQAQAALRRRRREA